VRPRWIVLIVVAGLLAAGCGGHGTPQRPSAPRTPVVVDTDMSTDDVLGLLYLVGRRELDVRAVAVSGTGLVDCPAGARNARALLAVAGRSDVPVGCGRADPLAGANAFPPEWRSRADALFGLDLPPARRAASQSAVDVLRGGLKSADGKATVLVLGPMTDLAQFAARTSARPLADRLRRRDGRRGRRARQRRRGARAVGVEPLIDPVAAREVLRSGLPTTLVGLGATKTCPPPSTRGWPSGATTTPARRPRPRGTS
jgi:inosine-uridine nucleoside N-ribohydrolase